MTYQENKSKVIEAYRDIDGVYDVEVLEEERDKLVVKLFLDVEETEYGFKFSKSSIGAQLGGITRKGYVKNTWKKESPEKKMKGFGGSGTNLYDKDYYTISVTLEDEAVSNRASSQGFKEGDFIYTSWGYDQTNVEFAKIVSVSDTGKTVKAVRVPGRRVDKESGKGNMYVEPVDSRQTEAHGDEVLEEFRLQVRDGFLVGSYPLSKNDSTRKGNWYKYEGKPRRETAPGFGH